MPVEPNDWRLTNQDHLKGRSWVRKPYTKYRDNWDHDHCSFCFATIMEPGTPKPEPDVLHEGYSTQNDYYWVCPTCFSDFEEMFQWTVTTA